MGIEDIFIFLNELGIKNELNGNKYMFFDMINSSYMTIKNTDVRLVLIDDFKRQNNIYLCSQTRNISLSLIKNDGIILIRKVEYIDFRDNKKYIISFDSFPVYMINIEVLDIQDKEKMEDYANISIKNKSIIFSKKGNQSYYRNGKLFEQGLSKEEMIDLIKIDIIEKSLEYYANIFNIFKNVIEDFNGKYSKNSLTLQLKDTLK